ncbi:MAG TPA: glycoside hydrolase family 97 N-terminal domain-containing protein, partial [Candidatus Glassbacteria bacterium]|nr:glycoside hydrolase family 97 N-terminal domain-containing protein [Candidatus Glassbacteria bacterium]
MYNRLAALPALMLITALSTISCGKYASSGSLPLKSPDNRIEVTFDLKEIEAPYPEGINMYYQLKFDNTQILRESPLGINFGPAGGVYGDVVILGVKNSSGVDQFDTPFSKHSSVQA